jgi:hypothetical protein
MIWLDIDVLSEEEKVGNIKLVCSNLWPDPFYIFETTRNDHGLALQIKIRTPWTETKSI